MDYKGKKILIVDDEEDLCEILQYNLDNEGFITGVAHSAEEALDNACSRIRSSFTRCYDGSNIRFQTCR